MKTYLVGGAVRDALLGIDIKERDYVVVSSTPDALIEKGFRRVGADFPVFLHPKTHEEYALARTERKKGSGYHGFICDFSPTVTLEEDLKRRDLTINAMAKTEAGEVIDPYGGRADIEARVLRHVSEAFIEDPLRVLRVARFAATFKTFGFTIAPETKALMKKIVDSGELQTLVKERVWLEFQKALQTKSPWTFIEILEDIGALSVILPTAMHGITATLSDNRALFSDVMQSVAEDNQDISYRYMTWIVLLEMSFYNCYGETADEVDFAKDLKQKLHLPNHFERLTDIAWKLTSLFLTLPQQLPETIFLNLRHADWWRKPEELSILWDVLKILSSLPKMQSLRDMDVDTHFEALTLYKEIESALDQLDEAAIAREEPPLAAMRIEVARLTAIQNCLNNFKSKTASH